MNKLILLILTSFLIINNTAYAAPKDKQRKEKQLKLDKSCEIAREKKLAPERKKYVKECVSKGQTKKYCKNFYKDHGARAGYRAPLYYDLPECVKAFDYSQSYRR